MGLFVRQYENTESHIGMVWIPRELVVPLIDLQRSFSFTFYEEPGYWSAIRSLTTVHRTFGVYQKKSPPPCQPCWIMLDKGKISQRVGRHHVEDILDGAHPKHPE